MVVLILPQMMATTLTAATVASNDKMVKLSADGVGSRGVIVDRGEEKVATLIMPALLYRIDDLDPLQSLFF